MLRSLTAVDGDGDTKTIDLTINLDFVANIDANANNIITNATDGDALNVSYDSLLYNDNITDTMSVSDVVADAGTDISTTDTDLVFSDIADGEGVTYTVSDATTSDSAYADITIQNSDALPVIPEAVFTQITPIIRPDSIRPSYHHII